MASRAGTLIGRYEVDAELGRGAMGIVYRGRDPIIDRAVAIKTISLLGSDPVAEKEYCKRFIVEAKAAGRLSHSGIVTIFDVAGPETEAPYLVMEYVEGKSLQKLISGENHTLPLSTTLQLVQEVAEALHYAHAQGVVHRDIKPANILVDVHGHAKVADFGIAKLDQTGVTLPGQVLGSPAYMAPEQLSDEGVDGRSDLFSLGVIFYYLLTGHRPFQGNSMATVCFKVANHDPVAVTTFNSHFPPEIDQIVSRAIAKDPGQRYQTGMELAKDIRQLRDSCGFIQKPDRTASSLKKDAIPRYVAGVTGERLEQKGAAQPIRSWFKWNGLLPVALLAIAIAFVTRTAIKRAHPEPGPPATREQAIGKSIATNKNKNTPVTQRPGKETLQMQIQHHFVEARAWLWLDDRLLYTHSLRGDSKTRALVFRKVEGLQFITIVVPTGKHTLRARIQSVADHYDQSKTIDGEFTENSQSRLEITCGKKHDNLELTLQRRNE